MFEFSHRQLTHLFETVQLITDSQSFRDALAQADYKTRKLLLKFKWNELLTWVNTGEDFVNIIQYLSIDKTKKVILNCGELIVKKQLVNACSRKDIDLLNKLRLEQQEALLPYFSYVRSSFATRETKTPIELQKNSKLKVFLTKMPWQILAIPDISCEDKANLLSLVEPPKLHTLDSIEQGVIENNIDVFVHAPQFSQYLSNSTLLWILTSQHFEEIKVKLTSGIDLQRLVNILIRSNDWTKSNCFFPSVFSKISPILGQSDIRWWWLELNIFKNPYFKVHDKLNLLNLLNVETKGKIINGLPLYYLRPLLKNQPNLKEYFSSKKSSIWRETGNILGLKGSFEGEKWEGSCHLSALNSNKNRFFQLTHSTTYHFDLIENVKNSENFVQELNSHGDYKGFICGWEKHSFSFHFIRDQDKVHIIYVNRGRRHEQLDSLPSSVLVFSISAQDKILMHELFKGLATQKRNEISEVITQFLMPYLNQNLVTQFKKSNQKVGNCGYANSNITWHFHLCAQLMKTDGSLCLSEAYQRTKPGYKRMRALDRAVLLLDLLRLPQDVYTEEVIIQIMQKMIVKDTKDPERKLMPFIVNYLQNENLELLQEFFKFILSESFFTNIKKETLLVATIFWASHIYRILPERINYQRLYDEFIAKLPTKEQLDSGWRFQQQSM